MLLPAPGGEKMQSQKRAVVHHAGSGYPPAYQVSLNRFTMARRMSAWPDSSSEAAASSSEPLATDWVTLLIWSIARMISLLDMLCFFACRIYSFHF